MVATCNLHLHQRNHWVQTKINKCICSREYRALLSEAFPVNSDFTDLPDKSVAVFLIWFLLGKRLRCTSLNPPLIYMYKTKL